ncbi:ZSC29 protein, partial [Setophaga kirtlandii]|nr:ZSC29 protein [Setophaga kirtlandii]
KGFSQNSNLATHRRIHTSEKPFNCWDCGKCFGGSSAPVQHWRMHTGEWLYTCRECGKSFSISSNHHTHGRERPHLCPDACGKGFSQNSNLATHRRIHTSEKPFNCWDCGKCFGGSSAPVQHWRMH